MYGVREEVIALEVAKILKSSFVVFSHAIHLYMPHRAVCPKYNWYWQNTSKIAFRSNSKQPPCHAISKGPPLRQSETNRDKHKECPRLGRISSFSWSRPISRPSMNWKPPGDNPHGEVAVAGALGSNKVGWHAALNWVLLVYWLRRREVLLKEVMSPAVA